MVLYQHMINEITQNQAKHRRNSSVLILDLRNRKASLPVEVNAHHLELAFTPLNFPISWEKLITSGEQTISLCRLAFCCEQFLIISLANIIPQITDRSDKSKLQSCTHFTNVVTDVLNVTV